MKQYLLSIYQPESDAPPPPEFLERVMADVNRLNDEIKAAGGWVFGGGLNYPSTATVLRVRGEQVLVTDGPFTESKEYLGGFSIVKADDLDTALDWGRKLARATGLAVEVRPFVDESAD
ncbi:MAG: YciI family protein [Mycobacteriales bacterium]